MTAFDVDLPEEGGSGAPARTRSASVIDNMYCMALVFVGVGFLLVFIAMLYPLDEKFPTNGSAAEIERIQLENERIRQRLDDVTLSGVIAITIGGLLLAIIMFYMLYTGDLQTCLCGDMKTMTSHEERHRLSDCDHLQKQYGGRDNGRLRPDLQMDDVILYEQTLNKAQSDGQLSRN